MKWKQGEQHAMQHMAAADRKDMLPILELQPPKAGALLSSAVVAVLDRSKLQGMPVGLDLRLACPRSARTRHCAISQALH